MTLNAFGRPLPAAILIGALAQALFTIRLAVPHQPVFDEVHYLPAARAMLALSHPANTEHPLLGKMLIAAGIALFGDTPVGWRFFSTFAGTATVVASFAILQIAYARVRTSALGAMLVLLNFTVFIQARIGMLDGYMAAFLLAGIALLVWTMRDGGGARWLAAAMCFGAAVACKWAALPYAALAGAGFLWLKREDPARFGGIGLAGGALTFATAAAATYFASFLPAFFYAHDALTPARLLPFQLEMLRQQTQVLPGHTYQSRWWTWPIGLRAIWYLYEPADGAQRGILMIGNPAIMWGGLAALLACCHGWVKSGDRRPLAFALLWLFSLAIWAVIPKSLGFYYYYYVSSILICLAIAAAFDHWRARCGWWDIAFLGAAFVLFVEFLPILSAQALPDANAFHRWTWLPGWV